MFHKNQGIDNRSEGAELIFLALAVSLAQFAALPKEALPRQAVPALATVELGEDPPAEALIIYTGQQVERLRDAPQLANRPRQQRLLAPSLTATVST